MNTDICDRIKDLAPYIERFRELEEKEQAWLKELMKNGRTVLSCLELLGVIENQSLNYYELGDALNINWQTAKQKLNAMIAGGIAIKEERDGRFISPKTGGRPRKLARKK
jgi:predicted transcriptional regulator